jgi:hypothetical protein
MRGARGGSIQPMFKAIAKCLGCPDQGNSAPQSPPLSNITITPNTAPQTFTFSWNGSLARLLNSQGTPISWFDASVGGAYRTSAMYTNHFQTLFSEEGKGYQTLLMHLIAKIAQQQGLQDIEIHAVTFGTSMDTASIKWGFLPDLLGTGGDKVLDTNTVLTNTLSGVLRRGFVVPSVVTGNNDTITKN